MNVLVVDDNRSAADALARALRKHGERVEVAYDGGEAISRLGGDRFDVVLTDLKMEPVDGLAVLRAARGQVPPVETLVFTAYGGVDVAVEAMRLGAMDFLTKPVSIDQILQRLAPLRATAPAPGPAPTPAPPGASAAALALRAALERVAPANAPVWLTGEVGSGRRYAARTLHALARPEAPFTVFDVARDPSWPTAGVVLLPNVDILTEPLQRRLSQALAHRPEGLRLVSTAGPDARRAVAEGRLLPELYYALCVLEVAVPPLRERAEDVLPLFREALQRAATRYDRPVPVLSPDAVEALQRHAWPGNLRELVNLAERAVLLGLEGLLEPLAAEPAPGLPKLEPGFSLADYMDEVERSLLEEALRLSNGDRNQAGRLLGVERNALRYKLNKYGLLER